MIKEFEGKTILLVAHAHVLRAVYWYFNGLPEQNEEIIINIDNCEFYEFDTE